MVAVSCSDMLRPMQRSDTRNHRCKHVLKSSLHSSRVLLAVACKAQSSLCPDAERPVVKYAVVGAGIAGLATAYHLAKECQKRNHSVELHLYDAVGIAAGGTGAAAGLLHPISPKGKLLWRGEDAMNCALELLAEVEAAAAATNFEDKLTSAQPGHTIHRPFVWRHGMVRPAVIAQQTVQFAKASAAIAAQKVSSVCRAEGLTLEQLQTRAPGILSPGFDAAMSNPAISSASTSIPAPKQSGEPTVLNRRQRRQQQRGAEGVVQGSSVVDPASLSADPAAGQQGSSSTNTRPAPAHDTARVAGLLVPGGVTLHVDSYCEALWQACQQLVSGCGDGSCAMFHRREVRSVAALNGSVHGPFDAVVVAAGAAVGTIRELTDVLPMQICQGYTLIMQPGDASPLPPAAPSILGSTYLANHGSHAIVVGASKSFGWSPEAALAMCQPEAHIVMRPPSTQEGAQAGAVAASSAGAATQSPVSTGDARESSGGGVSILHMESEVQAAEEGMLQGAEKVWPPIRGWQTSEIRSGMRGLPPRTPAGSIPMAGRISIESSCSSSEGGLHPLTTRRSTAREAAALTSQDGFGETGDATGESIGSSVAGSGSFCKRKEPALWVLAGLGARGLLYHAWLGAQVAAAVVADDEGLLAPELCAWRSVAVAGAQFEP